MSNQHIEYRAFVNYLKIAKSEIYIARIKTVLFVGSQYSSEVIYLEHNNISTLNFLVSDVLKEKSQAIKSQFENDLFSSNIIKYAKYRGYNTIQCLETYNLIKSK